MKIVMLMSGGVDSSVAAYLLKEQGHQVIGIHFKMVAEEIFTLVPEESKVCARTPYASSPEDTKDARRVAEELHLDDFQIIHLEKEFRDTVIRYFLDHYRAGLTPNPCIVCNRLFKFGKAVEIAKSLRADFVSTGHYAMREYSPVFHCDILKRGIDNYKDQSYFLSMIRKEVLPFLYFPLGTLRKEEIRAIAQRIGLSVAQKPDSQEICFIPDNNYTRFLEQEGVTAQRGTVVDMQNTPIGTHSGFCHYTIGQRSGMSFYKALQQKLFVFQIIPETNTIVVAPFEAMLSKTLTLKNVSLQVELSSSEVFCQIRKKSTEERVKIQPLGNQRVELQFENGVFAISPGQFAVLYDREGVLLGAGEIEKTTKNEGS